MKRIQIIVHSNFEDSTELRLLLAYCAQRSGVDLEIERTVATIFDKGNKAGCKLNASEYESSNIPKEAERLLNELWPNRDYLVDPRYHHGGATCMAYPRPDGPDKEAPITSVAFFDLEW